MSWTSVFESLHSATIDELSARFPDEQKELGMPFRQAHFAPPASGLELYFCEINLSGKGLGFLAIDPLLPQAASVLSLEFWSAILKRAEAEFLLRKIKPIVGKPEAFPKSGTPQGIENLHRTIWMPMKLKNRHCFMGLGV